ncbi:peptidoglycan DD-metalloendopeptidase family protein [Streptomyces sp. URMC 126]|uniref:M23 family metallopeptidase n=1 Tax=Streptomyces sp. URMC 126 TaxID=3423401 RepID=UPI003F1AD10A
MASNRSADGDGSHGSWAESSYGDEPGSSPVPPPPGGVGGPPAPQGAYDFFDAQGSFEASGSYDAAGSYGASGAYEASGASGAYDVSGGHDVSGSHDVYGAHEAFDASDPYGSYGYAGPVDGPVHPEAEAGASPESAAPAGPGEEYEPPVRGRHRVPKQRGGSMARSGAVLGVGVIAAVGAGGMASAQERPAAISVPDVSHLPGVGPYLIDDGDDEEGGAPEAAADHSVTAAHSAAPGAGAPAEVAGAVAAAEASDASDAGEALRARILQQADRQQPAETAHAETAHAEAAHEAHEAQERAAADAQRMAAARATAERKARTAAQAAHAATAHSTTAHPTTSQHADGAAHAGHPHSAPRTGGQGAKARAAAAAGAQTSVTKASSRAQAEARRAAERIETARAKRTYVMPVSSYRITARYGQHGGMWSHRHTGTDFAAPTGSPVKAVHGGRIVHAGWAGSYGYRIVLRLDDGTEVWFCHLSSMVVTKGKVAAGQVIGRVGATGNVTGPHLHLEVRPHGGHPVDPLHWLRSKGLRP